MDLDSLAEDVTSAAPHVHSGRAHHARFVALLFRSTLVLAVDSPPKVLYKSVPFLYGHSVGGSAQPGGASPQRLNELHYFQLPPLFTCFNLHPQQHERR
ncbi:hypothetical protein CC2G_003670 [Coprinopsis cinerea AmutBmut pab1-1]|nr:hypothetical protein CC2G_003670 [Coprinopsis cinerea AmutBmut pab1-1]